MQTLLKSAALALVVALGAGCAATPTQESTGEMAEASLITGKVKAALAADSVGTLAQVEVETFRDTVQLSGFVDSEQDKMRAGEIAEGVEGVGRVENSLVVKPAS